MGQSVEIKRNHNVAFWPQMLSSRYVSSFYRSIFRFFKWKIKKRDIHAFYLSEYICTQHPAHTYTQRNVTRSARNQLYLSCRVKSLRIICDRADSRLLDYKPTRILLRLRVPVSWTEISWYNHKYWRSWGSKTVLSFCKPYTLYTTADAWLNLSSQSVPVHYSFTVYL